MKRLLVCAALLAPLAVPAPARAEGRLKWSMELSAEGRYFPNDAAYAGQSDDNASASVSALPEVYYEWSRDGSLTFTPFGRWDSLDDERSHADIRELAVQQRLGNFDLRVGVSRVFWGVTESVHLVDIINQTDLVENLDGEDKLGQPMVMLSWTTDYGVFTAFGLPYFRERTLPGAEGRFRSQFAYAEDDAIYESGAEQRHFDAALRWSLSTSLFDLGISHFSGTGREPRFAPRVHTEDPGALASLLGQLGLDGLLRRIATQGDPDVQIDLVPVYDLIDQTGLDLNVVTGGWIWKLEAIHQSSRGPDYTAVAGGFEYTFFSVFDSSWDIGVLTEYLWDSRRDDPPPELTADDLDGDMLPPQIYPPLFQNDLFFGTRLSANDVAGTELLAGMVVDLDHNGAFGNVEASRRIGNDSKLSLELRVFDGSDPQDPLSLLRQDDYLQLEYTYYF